MSSCLVTNMQAGSLNNPACCLDLTFRNLCGALRFYLFMSNSFSSQSDVELLKEIANLDHDAFSELVRRYSKKLYYIAYRILDNRNDAEDIVQEAFLKLWDNPGIWKENYNNRFSTFFYRVVTNKSIDHKRRSSYRHHEELEDYHTGSMSTDKIIETKNKNELINRYIHELPERQQLALNLCYYENLSSTEAAEIMELSPKGIQSLILRAKENLRNKLKLYIEKKAI